jgi:alkanesulfonate monooxygenase SsuD/methylene tetrahydromethanopterin reductase-like flavin-dependent oxidoreductase (luciferase family)
MNAPPNPILMGAHVAAHCRKIRVGTCPVILPDWHPLRVAEDVAMLDNMTLGRVDFGVAKGINERSTIQFNRDADRRDNDKVFRLFQESLEVILKAWTDEAFTHKGEFYEFPVPGWKETNRFFSRSTRAITRKTESIRRSTSIRGPIRSRIRRSGCCPTRRRLRPCRRAGLGRDLDVLGAEAHAGLLGALSRGALGPARAPRPARRGRRRQHPFYVGETMEEAVETIRPSINAYYEFLGGSRPQGEWTKHGYLDIGEAMTPEYEAMDWFDFLNARGIIIVGDAAWVRRAPSRRSRRAIGLRPCRADAAIYRRALREDPRELGPAVRACRPAFRDPGAGAGGCLRSGGGPIPPT